MPTETPTPVPVIRTVSTLQVRIGPAEGYAILGTLNRGSEIDVQGRDSNGDWVAIEFPPGSSARGWIPADEVEGLPLVQVFALDVLQADIIDTTPDYPYATDTPTIFEGNDGFPTAVATASVVRSVTPTGTSFVSPFVTPTPQPIQYGPTDLAIGGVSVSSDGSLRVVIDNLGPGDVPAVSVVVEATGFSPELLSTGLLRSGDSTVLRTSAVSLTETTDLSITIDPNSLLADSNRTNNTRYASLTP